MIRLKTYSKLTFSKGFTLVELVFAVTLTAIMLAVLTAMLFTSVDSWKQASLGEGLSHETNLFAEQLRRELKGALVVEGQYQLVENPPLIQGGGESESLFFISQLSNEGAGDLCGLAYRYNTDDFLLEKAVIDSDVIWEEGGLANGVNESDFEWKPVLYGVLNFSMDAFSESEWDFEEPPESPSEDSWDSENAGDEKLRAIKVYLTLFDSSKLPDKGSASVTDIRREMSRQAQLFSRWIMGSWGGEPLGGSGGGGTLVIPGT